MSNQFGTDFYQLEDTSHIKFLILKNNATGEQLKIENIQGKQASVKILYAISCDNYCKITINEAKRGLALYGNYTQEELENPGSHPNIKLLFDTVTNQYEWTVNVS